MREVLCGDNRLILPTLEAHSFHAVVTDGPYELGFMGRSWDKTGIVNDPTFWAECLRVLKPGGYLLSFGGTRTYHRMACAVEDAGFEIMDCLAWIYGQGFPKGTDKLKPAFEPVVLARAPFKGTVAQNVLTHGTGGLNIDGCRIEAAGREHRVAGKPRQSGSMSGPLSGGLCTGETTDLGRWPANVILDREAGEELDRTVGHRAAGNRPANRAGIGFHEHGSGTKGEREALDSGGPSRYFYCPKANRADRDGSKHPTMKPTELMRYLVRLVTPKGGKVLDPFCGAGGTGKACVLEGFDFTLTDQDPQSWADAERRIAKALHGHTPAMDFEE